MPSWLKAAFTALKGLVRLTATSLSLRFFLSSQLKAAERGLRQELQAQGLPKEAVKELTKTFRRSAKGLADGLMGFMSIRRRLAMERR